MNGRALRALHGALASAMAVVLAAVSHTVAGGGAPPSWLVGSAIVLGTPVATLLVGRRVDPLGVTGAVVAAQLVLHGGFSLVGVSLPAASTVAATPLHSHALWLPSAGSGAAAPEASALMLVAHALAAAVTVLVLLRGESAVRAIAGWILARAGRPLRTARVEAHRAAFAVVVASPALARRHSPRTRRGPPVGRRARPATAPLALA